MKRKISLVAFLLVLAAIAGYLLSKASLIGRVGISVFYTEYKFLKTWWQGGLVIFVVWMVLFMLQGLAQKKYSARIAKIVQIAAILLALIGLYFTYQDFRNNLSHRWLGERFHLGGYLFWLGWIIISVFYLTARRSAYLRPDRLADKRSFSASDTNDQPSL